MSDRFELIVFMRALVATDAVKRVNELRRADVPDELAIRRTQEQGEAMLRLLDELKQ